MIMVLALQVEDISKANLVAGVGPGFVSRSVAPDPIQSNVGVSSDSSSSNFVFGTVSVSGLLQFFRAI
jgi:hypothetical protein